MAALPLFSSNASGDCRAFSPLRLTNAATAPLNGRARCGETPFARKDKASAALDTLRLAQRLPDSAPDPVELELLGMGKHGREILAARKEVLSVLESRTACSAWYLSKDPDAVAMFRSLHLVVDKRDAGFIRKLALGQNLLYIQPYVATAQQFVGPGSTITINARGAFFEDARGVKVISAEGGPSSYENARLVRVGNYRGGSEEARVLTLLHEFGHIIDLLPLDAGVPNGPEISMDNTGLVLAHCRAELEAVSQKPKKVLPVNPALLRASARP